MAELKKTPSLSNDANLVSYWRFEGNSDDEKEINNGTDTNMSYGNEYGRFGQGANFNGVTSKIVLPSSASLKPTGNFSVGVWFKTSTTGVFRTLFQSWAQANNQSGIRLSIGGSNVLLLYSGRNNGTTQGTNYQFVTTSPTTVTDGLYHLGVGVWDGTNLKIYLDGQFISQTSWTNAPVYAATTYQRIGCGNNSGGDQDFYDDDLDDVFLFSRALTLEEIQKLYKELRSSSMFLVF